jgi:tetratricopeptide (TPR) repeat protein
MPLNVHPTAVPTADPTADPTEVLTEVLSEPRYWNVHYCRSFLDSFDERTVEDPYLARRWATAGVRLVSKVEEAAGSEQPVLQARARTLLGSSNRGIGDREGAERAYAEAGTLYADLDAPLDRADLRRRIAYLRMEQGRFDEALVELEAARDVFQAAGDEARLGLVLMAVGHVYQVRGDQDRALVRLIQALPLVERADRPQAVRVLVLNIAGTLAAGRAPEAGAVHDAIRLVRKGRAKRGGRFGHRARTLPDAKARWVLGLLYWRLPKRRPRALELLETAREDLAALGSPYDVAAVSLDLGGMYVHKKRWQDAESMAEQTLELLERVPAAATSYDLWRRAIIAREPRQLTDLAHRCRDELMRV